MRPSGSGLGNMSGQECTFSYMYTGQLPPGQVPDRASSTAGNLSGGDLSASPVGCRTWVETWLEMVL